MTSIRQAILKAADSIEARPELFDFNSILIPDDCGTPGCAIGWIAAHLKVGKFVRNGAQGPGLYWCVVENLPTLLGLNDPSDLYGRLDDIVSPSWRANPRDCASGLRAYADKYHPEHHGIPDSVRSIFDEVAA